MTSLTLTGTAYVKAVANRALESSAGIMITFPTMKEALAFRALVHRVRWLERKSSKRMFPEGDPRHGRSAYDNLLVSIAAGDLGHAHLTIVPSEAVLSKLTITDNDTGETINPEELI